VTEAAATAAGSHHDGWAFLSGTLGTVKTAIRATA
jgi:hypothetical protein